MIQEYNWHADALLSFALSLMESRSEKKAITSAELLFVSVYFKCLYDHKS